MKLTPHPDKADSLFLYYYFSSPQVQEQIIGNNIGSSVPGFNLGQLKTMELNLPPLPEQKAIASALSSLDDKIDLLHRQNKTLEALAETLFRQWFVELAPLMKKVSECPCSKEMLISVSASQRNVFTRLNRHALQKPTTH
jgi:type I restriction enzyme S subunit